MVDSHGFSCTPCLFTRGICYKFWRLKTQDTVLSFGVPLKKNHRPMTHAFYWMAPNVSNSMPQRPMGFLWFPHPVPFWASGYSSYLPHHEDSTLGKTSAVTVLFEFSCPRKCLSIIIKCGKEIWNLKPPTRFGSFRVFLCPGEQLESATETRTNLPWSVNVLKRSDKGKINMSTWSGVDMNLEQPSESPVLSIQPENSRFMF